LQSLHWFFAALRKNWLRTGMAWPEFLVDTVQVHKCFSSEETMISSILYDVFDLRNKLRPAIMLVLESTWCRGRHRCNTKAMLCVLNSGFFCEFVWSDEFEIKTSWRLTVKKIMYFFSWVYHKTKEKGSPWSCCVKVHVFWILGDEVLFGCLRHGKIVFSTSNAYFRMINCMIFSNWTHCNFLFFLPKSLSMLNKLPQDEL
jgi:hypothetical protein